MHNGVSGRYPCRLQEADAAAFYQLWNAVETTRWTVEQRRLHMLQLFQFSF